MSTLDPMHRLALLALLVLVACDSGADDPLIVRYTGTPITKADAVVPNEPFGPFEWTGFAAPSSSGGVVSLALRTSCGDGCDQTTTLTFEGSVQGGLPVRAAGQVFTSRMIPSDSSPSGTSSAPFAIARVEVQDWGPEVYSGIVYPVPQDEAFQGTITFWVEGIPLNYPD